MFRICSSIRVRSNTQSRVMGSGGAPGSVHFARAVIAAWIAEVLLGFSGPQVANQRFHLVAVALGLTVQCAQRCRETSRLFLLPTLRAGYANANLHFPSSLSKSVERDTTPSLVSWTAPGFLGQGVSSTPCALMPSAWFLQQTISPKSNPRHVWKYRLAGRLHSTARLRIRILQRSPLPVRILRDDQSIAPSLSLGTPLDCVRPSDR